jgi:hypothetical protein
VAEAVACDDADGASWWAQVDRVLYAGMVGYGRLVRLDDVGTLERLRAVRIGLIDPAIGSMVVDGAVRCAVKPQQMALPDPRHAADRAIRFCTG